ncbi:MAG TPA: hypothetical protein VG986_14155 [Pseudolabrys sp.]|nr:hypothetical protein [Pseudolabrys sp.]
MNNTDNASNVAKEIHVHASVLAELARGAGLEVLAYLLDWAADESASDADGLIPTRIM